jgi:hypothetical protein
MHRHLTAESIFFGSKASYAVYLPPSLQRSFSNGPGVIYASSNSLETFEDCADSIIIVRRHRTPTGGGRGRPWATPRLPHIFLLGGLPTSSCISTQPFLFPPWFLSVSAYAFIFTARLNQYGIPNRPIGPHFQASFGSSSKHCIAVLTIIIL